MTVEKGSFCITTEREKVDLKTVRRLLNATYWAKERKIDTIQKSIQHSLCFSLYEEDRQIGFLRVVTDYSVYAYLCDFVIEEAYRNRGLGQWMMQCALSEPQLQGLKRWSLITSTAQAFYRKFGFHEIKNAQNYMEIAGNSLG